MMKQKEEYNSVLINRNQDIVTDDNISLDARSTRNWDQSWPNTGYRDW